MERENSRDPYHAPRARVAGVGHQAWSPVIAEILGSGAIWARIISVVNWIAFAFLLIAIAFMLFGGVLGFGGPGEAMTGFIMMLAMVVLLYLPQAVMFWFYARSMGRYASAAKALRHSADEEDVARCFASSSTFMKATVFLAVLFVIFMILGILAAISLPAYQDYIMRAQSASQGL